MPLENVARKLREQKRERSLTLPELRITAEEDAK